MLGLWGEMEGSVIKIWIEVRPPQHPFPPSRESRSETDISPVKRSLKLPGCVNHSVWKMVEQKTRPKFAPASHCGIISDSVFSSERGSARLTVYNALIQHDASPLIHQVESLSLPFQRLASPKHSGTSVNGLERNSRRM